jgi:hypothetical protein
MVGSKFKYSNTGAIASSFGSSEKGFSLFLEDLLSSGFAGSF